MAKRRNMLLFLLVAASSLAQNRQTDSLARLLATAADYPKKIEALCALSLALQPVDAGKALQFADSALALARTRGDSRNEARSLNLQGDAWWYLGKFPQAKQTYLASLKINEEQRDSVAMAADLRDMGWLYLSEEKAQQALPYFLQAHDINKRYAQYEQQSKNCNDLSIVYRRQGDFKKALVFSQQAIDLTRTYVSDGNLEGLYGSLALIYQDMGELDKAAETLLSSLAVADKKGMSTTMVNCYLNLGAIRFGQKKYEEAVNFLQRSLDLAQQINYRQAVAESYLSLSAVYAEKGDYRGAFLQHKRYNEVKDSMLNAESNEQMLEMQAKYETEKKDKELIKKENEIHIQVAGAAQQTFQRNIFIAGFALAIVLALLLYRSYRLKRIANFKLSKQKEIIEEKQKEILDSIHYARRIQRVLLPSDRFIERTFVKLRKS